MKNTITIILAAAIAMSGCGGKKSATLRTQTALLQGEVDYPMPTAYEVTNRIIEAGAAFVISITNPVSSVDNYLTTAQKAINIGIYGADLAYVSVYNREQETRNYLNALHTLTNSLDIHTNFNADLVKKVEDNIDNKDTVISIVTASFRDTYKFLVNNGQDDISLFVLTGAWVEGVYVTAYLATTSERTTNMLAILAEQEKSLATLLGLLANTTNEELNELEQQLTLLKDSFALSADGKFTLEQATALRERIEQMRFALIK